ncbi:cyclic pyranopterin monophosphate synthase MoaC [Halorhodospira halochloris]|uniref:cyclic pyranopterin monophosphate synthase MoaC n=1 Tax=Halorhodospira halochloris TaxID=1052 RepID=UPI001EE999E7|nr:cyclic pyranopterin monophosphate synthase MoaC [Halorhodospira halochloris]MCG5529493.1 cyclic pyranopterin monophosphate synthase MoaC [Halorhodospira halochloris]
MREHNQLQMIDVSSKRATPRRAVACGTIWLGPIAYPQVRDRTLPKGDALALAETAGIQASKRCSDWIPLCHPLALDGARVDCELNDTNASLTIYAQVAAHAKTGVEMEALTAVQAALITIWDLAKQVEANLIIGNTRLLLKEGGKQGCWLNPDGVPEWIKNEHD